MSFVSKESAAKPDFSFPLVFASILLPFALGHFISYLYRNINAVVFPDLTRSLSLAADSLGLLTGAYFLAFALAQLPIGVALDRYGPRKVQVPMLIVAAAGALLFAQAQSLTMLTIARGMIGLGVAGCLMAAIKASSLWLPPERLPLSTALFLAVGGLGAMASTTPMRVALDHMDWRMAFTGLALCTVAVAVLIFFVVPEHPRKQQTRLSDMAKAVGQLYTSWSFWRLALFSLFAHATYMAVLGLWMGPWLRDVAQLPRTQMADALFVGTIAMVAGSLAFGWLTDALRRYGVKPVMVCGTGIALFLVVQALMIANLAINPYVIVLAFSFFGTATTMNYAIVAQSVPTHLTGRVSTSFNLLIFLLAFVVQWGIGSLIGRWGQVGGIYPQQAYTVALGINLALQIPGLLLWLGLKPWQLEPKQGS
jgi:MFS family permease